MFTFQHIFFNLFLQTNVLPLKPLSVKFGKYIQNENKSQGLEVNILFNHSHSLDQYNSFQVEICG